jgi:DNA (cytosine-5)-methyltransferase 1
MTMKKIIEHKEYFAVDLFSGCGGLSEGLRQAGFKVVAAIEMDACAAKCFSMNHPETILIQKNIRKVTSSDIKKILRGKKLDLLAGCPPCQGFSTVRRLNKKRIVRDYRNNLILDYLRLVKKLKPLTIMLENVPALKDYHLFKFLLRSLERLGYKIDYDIVNIAEYGVPQRRKRLVMVGSLLGGIEVLPATGERKTVRDAIGNLASITKSSDPLHKITVNHTIKVQKMIKLIPHNGGSRADLPKRYELKCHKKETVGFKDIYGRLRWDDFSSTITGGCLNPSKGRFLHPTKNRVITPREAALLQAFPSNYQFALNIPKGELAALIGNALPPKFSCILANHIIKHINKYHV